MAIEKYFSNQTEIDAAKKRLETARKKQEEKFQLYQRGSELYRGLRDSSNPAGADYDEARKEYEQEKAALEELEKRNLG